nr:wall-associated receptor kinase-like 20 [Ipomoea batatas]
MTAAYDPLLRRRHLFAALLLLSCSETALSARRCADCGSSPVPYPLSTGPDCGDPSYKVRCNNGALVFDTLNNTYPITSITPESQRLTISPSPLIPDTCVTADISTGGIYLNSSLPFNITSSNTILYLNCTEDLLESPLNCTASSLCHAYIDESGLGACSHAPICCSFKAGGSSTAHKLRVRSKGCSAYRSFVNLDESLPVRRWPQPALEFQWVSPPEPLCGSQSDDCSASPA